MTPERRKQYEALGWTVPKEGNLVFGTFLNRAPSPKKKSAPENADLSPAPKPEAKRRAIPVKCKHCGKHAARIELIPESVSYWGQAVLRVRGFIRDTVKACSDEFLDEVQIRAETDFGALHSVDQEMFAFICRECRVAYCRRCWTDEYITFDEGFYDDTRAYCPKGHNQMIQD